MKKLITLFAFVGLFACVSFGQAYQTAIGARLGYPFSISLKHFVSETVALEAMGGARFYSTYGWYNVGALVQKHAPITEIDNLSWYYGGGASAFFWNFDFNTDVNNTSIGIMGCVGLDYRIPNTKVNLSVDWVPVFFLNGYTDGFGGGYGALSARYILRD